MLNFMRHFVILSFIVFLSACSADGGIRGIGTFPNVQGWDANTTQNKPSKPAPLKRDSVFEERLSQIQQRLGGEPIMQETLDGNGQVVMGGGSVQKVALIVPLSGAQASLGQSMMVAGQLALQDMRAQNIQLLPRDSGATASEAVIAVNQAIDEGAHLILGPVFAGQVQDAKNSATAKNVPLIGFTTDWTAAGGNTYVMGFLPFQQVTRVMDFAISKGKKEVIIVTPNNEYGRVIASTAEQYNGIATTILRAMPNDTTGTMAAKLLQMVTPQTAVLFAYDGVETAQIISVLATANATPQNVLMMGTGILDDPSLAQNKTLEGVYFASAPVARRAAFNKRYLEMAGQIPHRLASLSYDAVALAAVLAKANTPNKYNGTAMRDPNGFSGVDGVFRFKDSGQIERNLAILTWKNGAISEIAPAKSRF